MSYTHCSHGKLYKDECMACDLVWMRQVIIPSIKSDIARATAKVERMRNSLLRELGKAA
jgi:hypothetical protein